MLKVENIHSSEHASNGVYCPCMAHTNISHCPLNSEIRAVDEIWQYIVVIVMINAVIWVMLIGGSKFKIAQIC